MQSACQRRRPHAGVIRLCSTTRRRGKTSWRGSPARRARADAIRRACGSLAVSKTFPPEAVRAVHALGQRAFGENYVQEAAAKMASLSDLADIEWHLIGPLQSNKAGIAASRFAWVQTVDRAKIAARLVGRAARRHAAARRLHSGQRERRSVEERGRARSRPSASRRPSPRCRGCGCAESWAFPSPPPTPGCVGHNSGCCAMPSTRAGRPGLPVDTLSMGMSADLEDAIAEGATLVRVGTSIFGARG